VAKSWLTVCFTYSLRIAIFSTDISQGSVVTRLGCGGVFVYDFDTNFLLNLTVIERIVKIGQYLVKLWARVRCLVFFDSRCRFRFFCVLCVSIDKFAFVSFDLIKSVQYLPKRTAEKIISGLTYFVSCGA